MKVYVVTAGEYSDYHVERVFLNKEIADRYAKTHSGGYDNFYVEEFEADDDKEFYQIKYFYAWYEIENGQEKFRISINSTSSLDASEDNQFYTSYSEYSYNNRTCITLKRLLKNHNINETILHNKYKQVCRDIYAKIKSLKEIEGWDEKMIQSWLLGNVDDYAPKSE